MDPAFIFLMFVLKAPIALLLYIVWWAIKAEPVPDEPRIDDDGGSKHPYERHARPRRPRPPRRGPHGDPPPRPPSRTRTVVAKARRVGS
ncbi:hypothetical protein BH20ACT17_BH20ACT17_16400 [soil metagenome]